MTDPLKLSNERVHYILSYPESIGCGTVPQNDEVRALAQAVLDLRTANAMLEATVDAQEKMLARVEGAAGLDKHMLEAMRVNGIDLK